ncbi:DUF1156 domain-containing protein [Brevibacillus centrosporus]|uniref:DUF1156 domain-containing protein n=1 Tax=Brevibacillus centrosporus TaxID=54910 RepID=UPI003D25EEEA
MPYYATNCPRGHVGKWLKFESTDIPIKPFFDEPTIDEPSEKALKKFQESIATFDGWRRWYEGRGYSFEVMGDEFNPMLLNSQERPYYRYWGPEIIYTFWAKHGPCQATGCGHVTPIMTNPVISVKDLTVKAWRNHVCENCKNSFDVEQKEVRMAPGVPLVTVETEGNYSFIDKEGYFYCPNCNYKMDGSELDVRDTVSKRVSLTLLVHPFWLKGANNLSENFGGTTTDSLEKTVAWNNERAKSLKLIEVRGNLPKVITCPDTGISFSTGQESGANKGRGKFVCASCGTEQQLSTSLSYTGKDAPISIYAYHCYCPDCDHNNQSYNGRYFTSDVNVEFINYALKEWEDRKYADLMEYWPESKIEFGHTTHQRDNLPNHGYTHWWKMFNQRQLLVLSQLLKSIKNNSASSVSKELLLGAFQQYLRNQNTFCIWNAQRDTPEPHFSNNNYYPKMNFVENSVFPILGRGNWTSSIEALVKGIEWRDNPFELLSVEYLEMLDPEIAKKIKSKSVKIKTNDPVSENVEITNGSSTDLAILDEQFDLIITDPPFGDNVQYAELADFFYVWLKKTLKDKYPEIYNAKISPKALEAVGNVARHPEDSNEFYKRILTECWKEGYRILKPGGILAFTFHHSEDEPWVAVLESLFDAGFYLEATYPIRSDESKGENAEFGSQKIEYDIIHVCRKRTNEPLSISWARLRRQMIRDISQLKDILNNHLQSGLTESDLQVIKRGKALEYFSKHYGKVYVEEGREFTVREALIGINQLLDDENDSSVEPLPVEAEVLTRQFLRIFTKTDSVQRNEMQNYLRGTGISSDEFENKMWCKELNRIFRMTSPLEFAKVWKDRMRKGVSYDLDQTLFLMGACFENSGINVKDVLSKPDFYLHPAVIPLLDWFIRNGGTSAIRAASIKAYQICVSWQERNQEKVTEQLVMFGMDEGV